MMLILDQVLVNQLYDEKTAEFRWAVRLNDFQLNEALFLINLQCHFRILPPFFLLNQQHPLKTQNISSGRPIFGARVSPLPSISKQVLNYIR